MLDKMVVTFLLIELRKLGPQVIVQVLVSM